MASPIRIEAVPLDHGGPVDWPFEPFPPEALGGSICDRFDEIVRRHAGRLAIQDAAQRLTYGELANWVARIAEAVDRSAVGRDGPIAVLLPTQTGSIAAMLGVLAAGRVAVPLDADHPDPRNQLIAAHAGAIAVVSAGAFATRARSLFSEEMDVIDIEALDDHPPSATALRRSAPEDPAFILYTSGSTGAPKGVFHSHRNILFAMSLSTSAGHFTADDRFIMVYSGAVIGGIRNALMALLNGASLHIMSATALGAKGLVGEIGARGVTVFMSVPTVLRRVVAALGPAERLLSVRQARFGGDMVTWDDVDAARRAFAPGVHINISAGSTECASHYAQWFVDDNFRERGGRLPIGRPPPQTSVRILDEAGLQLADGEVGEIVVSSRYLALGYWREPALTAAAFQHDTADPEIQVFRTGDRGKRRTDGLLEFAGRKDELIKLRGHRIEPSEIESELRNLSGVADAALVVRRHASGEVRSLVAYAELESGVKGLLPRHVMAMTRRTLPAHMRPSLVIILDALPRLSIQKIDRAALARLDLEHAGRASDRNLDPLLNAVAETFEQALRVEGMTPEDNLLSIGGDSLQAVDVILALEQRFGILIGPETFAESQNIRELAAWIGAAVKNDADR